MPESPAADRRRPWHRGLLSDQLTEVPVTGPDGTLYLVRLNRSPRVLRPSWSDPVSMATDFVRKNASALGETGWDVVVVTPATKLRAERTLFTMHIPVRPLVVDVTMAVHDALERGDSLWEG